MQVLTLHNYLLYLTIFISFAIDNSEFVIHAMVRLIRPITNVKSPLKKKKNKV